MPKSRAVQSIHTFVTAAVAVAAAILIILLLRFDNSRVDCQNSDGEYCTLILPNDVRTILSPTSTLNYHCSIFGQKAKVQGEAYLEINQKKNISIEIPTGTIITRDARILISTTTDEAEVICYEGEAEYKAKSSGEKAILAQRGRTTMKPHMPIEHEPVAELYPAQAYFSESFEDIPIDAVLTSIETFFGIEVESNFPLSRRFTGSFETPLYNEALDIVCIALSYQWDLKGSRKIELSKSHQYIMPKSNDLN